MFRFLHNGGLFFHSVLFGNTCSHFHRGKDGSTLFEKIGKFDLHQAKNSRTCG